MTRRPGIDEPSADDMAWVARQITRLRGRGRPADIVTAERAAAAKLPRVLTVMSTAGSVLVVVRAMDDGRLVAFARDTIDGTDPSPEVKKALMKLWGRKRPAGTTATAVPVIDDHTIGAWCVKSKRRVVVTTAELREAIAANRRQITVAPG